MKTRHKRLAAAAGVVLLLGIAATLVLNAFRSNLVFFFTPTQVQEGAVPAGKAIRMGGLVVNNSVSRKGMAVDFLVTDAVQTIPVRYEGILPDLFKEGKGVVVQGRFAEGVFQAREVLAKHDENYMPPEAAEALGKAGHRKMAP
ncbi:MAG: hypothetical protein RLZZ126_2082 [Pseudomonadota bacterium]|jgi:cytochrome c-type biogenesis protein CcmE